MPSSADALTWFDGHLDLAYLAVNGRAMTGGLEPSAGPHAPAACTLGSLRDGRVGLCLGTIFTEVGGTGPEGYAAGDFKRAFAVGRAQLEVYLTWRDQGTIALDLRSALRAVSGVGEVRAGMGVSSVRALSAAAARARLPRTAAGLRVGILMENADPIRSPDDVAWWVERGLVAVGLAWARSSRYAGGNTTREGLTDVGRELVRALDAHRVVHDASHLSERAFDDLCAATPRVVIASHSNARTITDPSGANQRHLTDDQIRAIAARGGVIGINLFSAFLRPGLSESGRADIVDVVRHIEHIAEIADAAPGSAGGRGRAHVALGSDMDGGFSAARLPSGIDTPSDLMRIAEALRSRGWSDAEIADFACGNWLRVLAAGM